MNWDERIKELEGWTFGDNPEMADALAALVVEGKKTGTTGLLSFHETLPKEGSLSYIQNSKGKPLCVVRLAKVEVKEFQEVDAIFARSEGEGDLSLDYWRKAHREYFLKHDPDFTEKTKVVCETYEVVHKF